MLGKEAGRKIIVCVAIQSEVLLVILVQSPEYSQSRIYKSCNKEQSSLLYSESHTRLVVSEDSLLISFREGLLVSLGKNCYVVSPLDVV